VQDTTFLAEKYFGVLTVTRGYRQSHTKTLANRVPPSLRAVHKPIFNPALKYGCSFNAILKPVTAFIAVISPVNEGEAWYLWYDGLNHSSTTTIMIYHSQKHTDLRSIFPTPYS